MAEMVTQVVTNRAELDEIPQGLPAPAADHRHELRDANLGLVALSGAILIVTGLGILGFVYGELALCRRAPAPVSALLPPIRPTEVPPPRLWRFPEPDHLTPQQNYEAQQRAEDHILTTYGWADPAHSAVRLPIARAKELLLASPTPATVVPAQGTPIRAPENETRLSAGTAAQPTTNRTMEPTGSTRTASTPTAP